MNAFAIRLLCQSDQWAAHFGTEATIARKWKQGWSRGWR